MQCTLFNTRGVTAFLAHLSRFILWSIGWRTLGNPPVAPKYVIVAAPHTSNWDLPITLMIALSFRVQLFWMGKSSLFRRPFGAFFRWLGGVPIDRSRNNNVVAQTVSAFRGAERFVLGVAPEGTRKRVSHWKTGFYYIALQAHVPIALGFLDYRRKLGGIGPIIHPSGNIGDDMKVIRQFYATITGKYADESAAASVAVTLPGSTPQT